MTNINYSSVPGAIENRENFKAGSITGAGDVSGDYSIFSYDTLIAKIKGSKVVYFNKDKYSNTTGKIQNLIVDVFNLGPKAREGGQKVKLD